VSGSSSEIFNRTSRLKTGHLATVAVTPNLIAFGAVPTGCSLAQRDCETFRRPVLRHRDLK